MNNKFENLKISNIVAFDHDKFEFTPENIDALRNSIIFKFNTLSVSVEKKRLIKRIYSEMFVERYPEILNILLKIDLVGYINEIKSIPNHKLEEFKFLLDFISESCGNSLSRDVEIKICFDKLGISSARFDFLINQPLETHELIDTAYNTASFVDNLLFPELNSLINLIPNLTDEKILKVHDTYPVICSKNFNSNLSIDKKEIAGIISLNKHYLHFNDEIVKKEMENSFYLYEGALIVFGFSATFMLFQDPERFTKNPDSYIDDRIIALEMYHRQKNLLKKIDTCLDDLIRDLERDSTVNNLKNQMDIIKKTQIEIQSKLEIYRNTRISVKESFITFFDLLNEVFYLDKHYKFVLEKLDACDEIYQGLYNNARNELMEDIQLIVAILGILSLVILFIDVIIDAEGLIQLVLILIFTGAIWISRRKIIHAFNTLKKQLINSG